MGVGERGEKQEKEEIHNAVCGKRCLITAAVGSWPPHQSHALLHRGNKKKLFSPECTRRCKTHTPHLLISHINIMSVSILAILWDTILKIIYIFKV